MQLLCAILRKHVHEVVPILKDEAASLVRVCRLDSTIRLLNEARLAELLTKIVQFGLAGEAAAMRGLRKGFG